jgi:hypothetical protein
MEQAMEPPQVIEYASAPAIKPRITFRGAVTTLIVGGAFLLLAIALISIAWAIFRNLAELNFNRRADSMEALGAFVCVLAGISFLFGLIVCIMGLRGVRQREIV